MAHKAERVYTVPQNYSSVKSLTSVSDWFCGGGGL